MSDIQIEPLDAIQFLYECTVGHKAELVGVP